LIGDDVRQFVHPELGDLVKDDAFTRDRCGHDDIKRGDPVGGDDQHMLVIDIIDITDFSAMQQWQAFYVAGV
jgi:hypothetical protein